MTDAEIIKALECCCKNNNCEGCPLDYLTFSSQCASELAIKSLDLINRQKAEIESLQKENNLFADLGKLYSEIKAEAIKEFWNELKSRNTMDERIVSVASGDNLVKEMAGDTK